MNQNNEFTPILLDDEVTIDRIYSLHYFTYSRFFDFEGESHDFWELVYCDSGEALISDDGEKMTLPAGCAFLHAPGHYHTIRPNNTETNAAIVSFNGKLGAAANLSGQMLTLTKQERELFKRILSEGRTAIFEPLNVVFQFKLTPSPSAPFGALQFIKNTVECLLISLCRPRPNLESADDESGKTPSRNKYIADRIIEILNESMSEKIRLSFLAEQLNYSPTYIKRVFKEATGQPIIQYFIALKIERAKQLLDERDYTITEISDMLGFDSVQYFSRQFKKLTNMSPSAYIRSVQKSGVL